MKGTKMNATIKKLHAKLQTIQGDVCEIENQLQTAYNKAFDKDKAIKSVMAELEASQDFICDQFCDQYREISSYVHFDLSDYRNCKDYFINYMHDFLFVSVDFKNDCLTYGQGESITIQDDTRHDNGVWLSGKCVIDESEYKQDGSIDLIKRNSLIEAYMEKTGYFPGVFRCDSHGNVFSVDTKGK